MAQMAPNESMTTVYLHKNFDERQMISKPSRRARGSHTTISRDLPYLDDEGGSNGVIDVESAIPRYMNPF